jgi:pSer/pThr/pTyr-binding forkhead associated (FHA) protein
MYVVLEVVSGPGAGRRVRVHPGHIAHVGRTTWADLSIPEDPSLLPRHFLLECGQDDCRLRDVVNTTGTRVNGVRVVETAIHDGDEIVAGETTFRVRIEGTTAAVRPSVPAASPPAVPAKGVSAEEIRQSVLRTLWREGPLFALVDGAASPEVRQFVNRVPEQCESLYEGPRAAEFAPHGPFLLYLPADSVSLLELVRDGWGKSYSVYLSSRRGFREVRQHLRRFLKVRLPDGAEGLFRFYDPFVLRVFLPTLTPEETSEFFGWVDSFLMEGDDPAILLRFTATTQGVRQETVPLFALRQTPAAPGRR